MRDLSPSCAAGAITGNHCAANGDEHVAHPIGEVRILVVERVGSV
jgi:hypothetical protein